MWDGNSHCEPIERLGAFVFDNEFIASVLIDEHGCWTVDQDAYAWQCHFSLKTCGWNVRCRSRLWRPLLSGFLGFRCDRRPIGCVRAADLRPIA